MTLLEIIKNNEDAKLIFGPGELRIIKKQLLGVKLTQSEKNRLSRNIRPKLNFIKKCSLFTDEFEVKKGGEILKQIEIIKDKILLDKKGKEVIRIFIFGSFVENKMSMDSDVDLAVEFKEINKKEASLFKRRILFEANKILDISVFNMLPKNIKKEVSNNGKTIYETN